MVKRVICILLVELDSIHLCSGSSVFGPGVGSSTPQSSFFFFHFPLTQIIWFSLTISLKQREELNLHFSFEYERKKTYITVHNYSAFPTSLDFQLIGCCTSEKRIGGCLLRGVFCHSPSALIYIN